MGVIGFLVRAEGRRRWPAYLVLALLLGVVAGAAMTSAAGARRTASSYERLLAETNGDDVLVNPDDGYADFDAIEALPEVRESCRAMGAAVELIGDDGEPSYEVPYLPFQSDGRCLFTMSAPARVEGRLPDPAEPYETFLSHQLAGDLALAPGDRLPVYVLTAEDAEPVTVELTVTGTGIYGQDALLDPENEATFPVLLLTPAFGERHPVDPELTFTGSLVQLRDGEADLAAFNAGAVRVAGESLHLEDRWANERKAALALEPYELALWLFTVAVVVAGGGMVLGALHRNLTSLRGDQRTLASLGIPPGGRRAVPVIIATAIGGAAALVGVVLAVVLSPISPIGPAHDIEPTPGVDVDLLVVGAGAVATVLAAAGIGLLVAATLDRREAAPRSERLGLLARLRLGLPAPAAAGMRLATGELGANRSAARSTLGGATLGVVAVLTVLVVGAGLTRVVDTPARYGWTWTGSLSVFEEEMEHYGEDGGGPQLRALLDQLDRVGVTDRTAISLGQVDLDGQAVPAVGLGPSSDRIVAPALLEGRLPTNDDEVALGSTTLERLGVTLGDSLQASFGTERRSVVVVGRAVFPRMTEYPGAPNTGLGDGALLTSAALTELTGALPYSTVLIDADDESLEALQAQVPVGDHLDIDAPVVLTLRPQRPDALFGYDSTTAVRQVLAYLLGGLTLASVALGLSAGARAARRELAVLRTIGFTQRQSRIAVHAHGAIVGAAAIALGVPLGLAAGRVAWGRFADHLGVAPDPITPVAVVAATALAVVAASLLLTIPPAVAVGRRDPAAVLRAE